MNDQERKKYLENIKAVVEKNQNLYNKIRKVNRKQKRVYAQDRINTMKEVIANTKYHVAILTSRDEIKDITGFEYNMKEVSGIQYALQKDLKKHGFIVSTFTADDPNTTEFKDGKVLVIGLKSDN